MASEVLTTLARLSGLEDDGPFGKAELESNRIKATVSHGLLQAADNLLAKALRAVKAGDDQRARGYAQRAAQLPFDDHEECQPGWQAATMLLFNALADVLEVADEDDSSWLTAAEQVLPTTSGEARHSLLFSLQNIAADYQLLHSETRRITALLRQAGQSDSPLPEPSEPQDASPAILAVVHAVAAYHAALDR